MRDCSSWKRGTPSSSSATISPSNTAVAHRLRRQRLDDLGVLPRRRVAAPAAQLDALAVRATNASVRTPSSFGSKSQPGARERRRRPASPASAAASSRPGTAPRARPRAARRRAARPSRGMRPSFRSWIVRPQSTERSSSRTSRVEAYSSRCLISSQFFGSRAVWTSVHEPRSFLPCSVNESLPAADPLAHAARCPPPCRPTSSTPPLVRRVGALVPDDDLAAAVVPLRDDALEAAVVVRVVLDVRRHALVLRVQRRAVRHRPRLEHAVDLEPEVPVHARRARAAARRTSGRGCVGSGAPAAAPASWRSRASGGSAAAHRGRAPACRACIHCRSRPRARQPRPSTARPALAEVQLEAGVIGVASSMRATVAVRATSP